MLKDQTALIEALATQAWVVIPEFLNPEHTFSYLVNQGQDHFFTTNNFKIWTLKGILQIKRTKEGADLRKYPKESEFQNS